MYNQIDKMFRTVLAIEDDITTLSLNESQKQLLIYLQENNFLSTDLEIGFHAQNVDLEII